MVEASGLQPTDDERTMATLAHALSLLGFIAPLVIFLIKRQSRFVSFHALQALLLQILYFLLIMVLMVAGLAIIFSTIAHPAINKSASPPATMFVVFHLPWLGFMIGWIFILIIAILYSVKASNGEWAEYPVLGRLARKLLKIGPGGAALSPQA
jgi:uncharacterized protein